MNTTINNDAVATQREIRTDSDRLFAAVYAATASIEYNAEWANGTGYLGGATSYENRHLVPIGEVRRTIDDFGRRILLVGTFFGPAVVFDRYGPKEKNGAYVCNVSNQLRACGLVTGSSALSYNELMEIIGSEYDISYGNVGQRVEKFRKAVTLYERVDAGLEKPTPRM
jgi:hypothetical protein